MSDTPNVTDGLHPTPTGAKTLLARGAVADEQLAKAVDALTPMGALELLLTELASLRNDLDDVYPHPTLVVPFIPRVEQLELIAKSAVEAEYLRGGWGDGGNSLRDILRKHHRQPDLSCFGSFYREHPVDSEGAESVALPSDGFIGIDRLNPHHWTPEQVGLNGDAQPTSAAKGPSNGLVPLPNANAYLCDLNGLVLWPLVTPEEATAELERYANMERTSGPEHQCPGDAQDNPLVCQAGRVTLGFDLTPVTIPTVGREVHAIPFEAGLYPEMTFPADDGDLTERFGLGGILGQNMADMAAEQAKDVSGQPFRFPGCDSITPAEKMKIDLAGDYSRKVPTSLAFSSLDKSRPRDESALATVLRNEENLNSTDLQLIASMRQRDARVDSVVGRVVDTIANYAAGFKQGDDNPKD